MTRADLLKGIAAAALARCFGPPLPAQQPYRQSLPALKRDDLILVSSGSPAKISIYSDRGTPIRTEQIITAGPHPTVLLPPGGQRLYVCFAPQDLFDTGSPQLAAIDLSANGATTAFTYPGPLSPRGVRLALSTDGRWLFTLTGRVPGNEHYRTPHRGGTPAERAIIYTFDTVASRFLPGVAETGHEFNEGMALDPGNRERQPWIVPADSFTPEPVIIRDDGSAPAPTESRSLKQDAPETEKVGGQWVANPDGPFSYYIQSDGIAWKVAWVINTRSIQRLRGIDAIARDRFLGDITISGDRKLLFVPTGPRRNNWAGNAYDWLYIDRISTYRTTDLQKIREQGLQQPLRRIWSNYDGSILFATEMPADLLVFLDADTLWRRRVDKLSLNIENIAVVE